MNLEKVVFGFFVVLAATLNFGFFIGDISDPELHNPYVTKVVVDTESYALYFSRAPIPFVRDGSPAAPAGSSATHS